jgi:hypothetical protein
VVLLGQHMELGSLDTTSAGPHFMLVLILLFGPCIINAVSRFISQQVQQIKLQLLVKEYSSLHTHEPSILFYRGPLEMTGQPETSTTSLTHSRPIVSMKKLDESSSLSPKAVGYLS